MITKEEMNAMVEEELKRLGVGSTEFERKCQELDDMIERAKAHFFTNKSDDDLTSEGQDGPSEEKIPEKTNDLQLLDDLGEIRHLLEKASNSLDSFQCRYKLVYKVENDTETQKWFFRQRRDMGLGLSIISDYITTACEKIHKIEKGKIVE